MSKGFKIYILARVICQRIDGDRISVNYKIISYCSQSTLSDVEETAQHNGGSSNYIFISQLHQDYTS